MKILFCQTQFKMGGQQKVVLTLAEGLRKNNDVTIYYENYNYFGFGKLNTIRPSKIIQLKNLLISLIYNFLLLKFRKKLVADYWHFLNLKSTLKNSEYDVVILVNPYILFVDEIKKLVNPKKIVCWTHNLYDTYVEKYFKYENEKLFSSMSKADLIISQDIYTEKRWHEINPNTMIIDNPLGIKTNGLKTELNNKTIGWVGRIDIDHKGLDYFCEMASMLDRDIKVCIVGEGSVKDEKSFDEYLIKYKVKDRIERLGNLPYEKLADFYRTLSAFVMTSRHEGFGLVAIESMAFGVPFVGFDIPAFEGMTKNQKYGKLLPFGNTSQMAEYINKLLNDKEELEKWSKLSLERANQLTLENIVRIWEEQVL
ncbi:glycosyltransferase [Streptococcus thermophilus]|nr:glycosyltransferase [Streptococcus thermophilus]MCE2085081.1 glycosyltransferase [Streptococcus thermophilus]